MSEQDPLDVTLEDAELRSEVQMTASLIIASNESEEPLCQDQIDRLLGLRD